MARKRVFFSLASGALLACFGLLACLLYLAQPRLEELGRFLDDMVAGTFVLGAGFLWLRFFCTALAAYQGRDLSPVGRSGHLLPTLLPLAILLGRGVGVEPDRVRSSFIRVNNALVGRERPVRGPLLILVPHCLQILSCTKRITVDVEQCRECGRCDIGALKALARERGAVLRVATGGGMARRIIAEVRPAGVVAVACERDLSEGIGDVSSLPVIGVLNDRPHGPCQDTTVPVEDVERALDRLSTG